MARLRNLHLMLMFVYLHHHHRHQCELSKSKDSELSFPAKFNDLTKHYEFRDIPQGKKLERESQIPNCMAEFFAVKVVPQTLTETQILPSLIRRNRKIQVTDKRAQVNEHTSGIQGSSQLNQYFPIADVNQVYDDSFIRVTS